MQTSARILLSVGTILLLNPAILGSQEDFEFIEDNAEKTATSASPAAHLTWILDPDNALCGLLLCGRQEICLLQDRFTAVCVKKDEVASSGDQIVTMEESQKRERDRNPSRSWDDDDYDDEDDYSDDDDDDEDDEDYNNESGLANGDGRRLRQDREKDKATLNRQPFARKKCPTCPVVRPVFLCGSDNRTYSSLCRLHYHNCLHDDKVRVSCKGFCPCKESNSRSLKKDRNGQRPDGYKKKSRRNEGGYRLSNKVSVAVAQKERRQEKEARANRVLSRFDKTKKNKKSYKNISKSKPSFSKYQKDKEGNFLKYYNKKSVSWRPHENDINHINTNTVWGPSECSQDALQAMGNRMLDWFSVIMADAKRRGRSDKYKRDYPSWCKLEVAWMLSHLDADDDGLLSSKELYQLEHDDKERCIKPFFDRCNLDRDAFLSGREWCKCFDKSDRPCAAVRKANKGLVGGYIPECDSEGYYENTQCHASAGWCWCVDKHGVEIPNTRTRNAPNCKMAIRSREMPNHLDSDTEEGDDDDEVVEGSADFPLVI